jgi:hypothetical protein
LRSWVDAELELALLAIVDRQSFHEQSSETRASTAAERVKDQETLETGAIVCNVADFVENLVNELFANCVMTTSIVVGSILLPSDHLFWVEKTAVGSSADFIDHVWLKVAVNGSGDIFAVSFEGYSSAAAQIGFGKRA